MQKTFILFAAIAFLIFGGGCATYKVHNPNWNWSLNTVGENIPYKYPTFTEEISSFLITQDGKQLIIIGKKYHYIFPATDETLKFILTWEQKKRVKAAFSDFDINSDQKVSGAYVLIVDMTQDLSSETKDLLTAKGFNADKEQTQLSYQHSIQGVRYSSGNFELPATMQLNKTYSVIMRENYLSNGEIMKRILLTPLSVTADGVLLGLGLGAAAVYIPVSIIALPIIILK